MDNRKPSLWLAAILGLLTSLPVIALSYLGSQFAGLPFIPFDLFDWLARVMPGNIINLGIDSEVSLIRLFNLGPTDTTAKTLEQTTGVLIVVASGAVLGFIIALILRRTSSEGSNVGVILGALAFVAMSAIELSSHSISGALLGLLWLAILLVTWGRLLGGWIESSAAPSPSPEAAEAFRAERRAALARIAGGSIGVAIVASGLGRWLELQQQASGAGQSLSSLATATPEAGNNSIALAPTPVPNETVQATLRDRISAAPGTRPELTATKDFYRIDIDTLPVVLDQASWKLQVLGLFDRPRNLTLSDLVAYPAVTQPITQQCISNPVAGDLISTANYTGARIRDVLADLGLRPQAQGLEIRGADGFYEFVGMQDLMDPRTLLVYGMNGTTLPAEHGFPLRIYIPNRYGMKQPKWIVSMEAIDAQGTGYWVDRGWSLTAFPQIISVIDTVAKDQIDNGRVPVGGIAWAGDRGIKRVEVKVDAGPWTEAVLRVPPLSPLTWVQWRYDWPVVKGAHHFTVRAFDGNGTQQLETVMDTFPDGATGYHAVTVTF